MVDVKELIAGLEGQLRQDFIKRMTKTLKRRPSEAEVDEKIAEMPGGALLPVEVIGTLLLFTVRLWLLLFVLLLSLWWWSRCCCCCIC